MSWDGYITSLTGSGHIAKAALVGLEGGIWAATAGFNPTLEKAVVNYEEQTLYGSGIKIAGTKYMFLRRDDKFLYGKKGQDGCCVFRTGKCLIVAVYTEGMQAGACNQAVGKIGEYLISVGY